MAKTTTKEQKKVFRYLNQLRLSGVTNMLAATRYIEKTFGYDTNKSEELLTTWMTNFDASGKYDFIKD